MSSSLKQERLKDSLIGDWKMDDVAEKYVDDDSGKEMHGTAESSAVTRGKFTHTQYFHSGGKIEIPRNDVMNLSKSDFSFCGWIQTESHLYPATIFGVQNALECYFKSGSAGSTPGWDIGHSFYDTGTRFCIRDDLINHNDGFRNSRLLGKWTDYVVVFNRLNGKIFLYINSQKQNQFIGISAITGVINNNQPLLIGYVYGWKTTGFLDDYKMYNKTLTDTEVAIIYNDHRV